MSYLPVALKSLKIYSLYAACQTLTIHLGAFFYATDQHCGKMCEGDILL